MVPLDEVLRPLAAVHPRASLATAPADVPVGQIIARVVRVGQQVPQALMCPLQARLFLALHGVECLTDVAVADLLLGQLECQTNPAGLRLVDMPFPLAPRLGVTVAGPEVRLSRRVAPLVGPQHVLADAVALFLRDGRKDAEHQLALRIQGIEALLG